MTLDCKTVRIFAYSSTRELSNKVWSEAENGEHESGKRRYGRVRLARSARVRLLRYAKPISRNKLTVLQSTVTLFLLFAFSRLFSLEQSTDFYRYS